MKKVFCLMLVLTLCVCMCACGDVATYESSSVEEISSTFSDIKQDTGKYKLPTADQLVDNFKTSFTLSEIQKKSDRVSFKISTGEQIIGYINGSGKVDEIWVHCSGTDVIKLLEESYHFYPVCQYLSDITGKTVRVDAVLDIINAVEPTSKATDSSMTMTFKNTKDGVRYKLEVCQYPSMGYSTMDFVIEIY